MTFHYENELPLTSEQEAFLVQSDLYWKPRGYETVLTGDGSPTLRTLKATSLETMHHRGGAYSETQLIYGEALRRSLGEGRSKILSVGLGLGYNEILFAVEALICGILPEKAFIESFEIDEELVNSFCHFIQKKEDPSGIYSKICEYYLGEINSSKRPLASSVNLEKIQDWLAEALSKERLLIRKALTAETSFSERFHVIFYDAFSSKTDPDLWNEEFLVKFWQQVAEPHCMVSTYACTGALKRSLKRSGFTLEIKQGFQSKRDRTLGIREI